MPEHSQILFSPVMVRPGAHDPYTPSELRSLRLELLFQDGYRHVWLGESPPFDCLALDLAASTGFRASGLLHGRFDVVWASAPEAYDDTTWPIVLDEALRLIGVRGWIVVRFPDAFSLATRMKSYLARKFGWRLRTADELRTAGGLIAIVEVERTAPAPADARWTIGMLTSGKRDAAVERMLRSVREGAGGAGHEILLFGPENPAFAAYDVRYLDEAAHGIRPNLNEIARKKNVLAEMAAHELLLVCHDRYYLGPGFLESFARFGCDFDIATANQVYADGQPFPALGAVGGMALDRLDHVSDVARFVDGSYVNGGFMLIRRALLRALPLNEMCFWNQAEDAEYSAILRERGVIPRYNALATAVTMGVGKKHCASFRDAFDGTGILLRYNRQGRSTGGAYHWDHGDYRVAETEATLAADAPLSLVIEPAPAVRAAAATLAVVTAAGQGPVEYRLPGRGWRQLAGGDAADPVRFSIRQEAVRGRVVVEFRVAPPAGNAAPAAATPPAAAKTPAATIRVVEVRDMWPVTLEFARGAFGHEAIGVHYWRWLAADARLVVLNPNPMPLLVRMSFGHHHVLPDGATRMTVPGVGSVALVGGLPDQPVRFAMTLLLVPGATVLELASYGAAPDGPLENDGRPLSLHLRDWVFETSAQGDTSLQDWPLLDYRHRLVAGAAEAADHRPDRAVLVQLGDAPTDRPLYVTLAGSFPPRLGADEALDFVLNGRHRFEGVVIGADEICLRVDPEMRAACAALLLAIDETSHDRMLRIDGVRISVDPPADGIVAEGRRDGRLQPGDRVDLYAGGNGVALLGEGWWPPEPEFCWTRAPRATIALPIDWPEGRDGTLYLEVSTLCAPDIGFAPTVRLLAGGRAVHEWQPQTRDTQTIAVPLDASLLAGERLTLALEQSAVSSSDALWGLGDDRPLGSRLSSLRLA